MAVAEKCPFPMCPDKMWQTWLAHHIWYYHDFAWNSRQEWTCFCGFRLTGGVENSSLELIEHIKEHTPEDFENAQLDQLLGGTPCK